MQTNANTPLSDLSHSGGSTGKPERTVLLGKGELAVRLARWLQGRPEFELALVVPVIPEPRWSDSIVSWSAAADIPVVASGNYREIPPELEIDLAISIFYERIIKPDFIARCGRIINLHNSPLPRYRGVSPINWALKNGEDHHGITVHEIAEGIDDGPILGQLTYSIYPEFDEVRDVYARALEYGYVLLTQTLPLLDRIVPRPQDESEATYFSMADNVRLGDRRDFTRAESVA
jgi:methionyl-tRNA formyltransferase